MLLCLNYLTIALISHASKVMLKILQARLQQDVNRNFQMFKLGLEKAEEPEIKLPTSAGSWKKQEFQKNICFIEHAKPFDCVLVKVAQSCPTLCDPMDYTAHGILQARIPE